MSAPRAAAPSPTPTAPVGGAVVRRDAVTFTWDAPPGAAVFRLRVAAASAPDAPLVELGGLPSTETTLDAALPAGEMLWWVATESGPWSSAARFTAGDEAAVASASRAAEAEATRRRAADRQAQRSLVPALPEAPPEPVWPRPTGSALPGAAPLDWARVAGFALPLRAAMPEAPGAAAPAPIEPLGGAVVDAAAPTLRWRDVPGATAYEVELSPHAAFDRDVMSVNAGPATALSLPGLLPAAGHQLLWRVRALTDAGATPWSRYGRFYPADEAATASYRHEVEVAEQAAARRRDYERRAVVRTTDETPLYARDDAATSDRTAAAVLTLGLSSIVLVVAALAVASLLS